MRFSPIANVRGVLYMSITELDMIKNEILRLALLLRFAKDPEDLYAIERRMIALTRPTDE